MCRNMLTSINETTRHAILLAGAVYAALENATSIAAVTAIIAIVGRVDLAAVNLFIAIAIGIAGLTDAIADTPRGATQALHMIVRTDPATRAAVERVGIETHLAAVGPFIAIAIGKARLTDTTADTPGATQGLHMVVGADRAAAAAIGWVVVDAHLAPVHHSPIAVHIPVVAGHAACIIGTGRNRIRPRWAGDAASAAIVRIIGGGNAGVATETVAGRTRGLADTARTDSARAIRPSPAELPHRTLAGAGAAAIHIRFGAVLHEVGASRGPANPAETNPAGAVVSGKAGFAIRTLGGAGAATIDVRFGPVLNTVKATRGSANPARTNPADAVAVPEAGAAIRTSWAHGVAAAAIDI